MTIFETVLKARNGHYVHAMEVETTYEIECAIESIWGEFEETHTIDNLKDFFNSMEIYCLDEPNEDEVYDFDIDGFIDENLI